MVIFWKRLKICKISDFLTIIIFVKYLKIIIFVKYLQIVLFSRILLPKQLRPASQCPAPAAPFQRHQRSLRPTIAILCIRQRFEKHIFEETYLKRRQTKLFNVLKIYIHIINFWGEYARSGQVHGLPNTCQQRRVGDGKCWFRGWLEESVGL